MTSSKSPSRKALKQVLTGIGGSGKHSSRAVLIDPSKLLLKAIASACRRTNYAVVPKHIILNKTDTTGDACWKVIQSMSELVDLSKLSTKYPDVLDLTACLTQGKSAYRNGDTVRGIPKYKGIILFIKLEDAVPELIRSCRDLWILRGHIHTIFYGNRIPVNHTVSKYPQTRSIFSPAITLFTNTK